MAIDGGLGVLFKQNLEPRGFHLQRIETGGTGRGIPDTHYAAPPQTIEWDGPTGDVNSVTFSVTGWVEFKVAEAWAVPTLASNPPQQGWLMRRARMGERVWIAVRQQAAVGARRERRDGLFLVHGRHAATLAKDGLRWALESCGTGVDVLYWPGPGPSKWDWIQIEQSLLK